MERMLTNKESLELQVKRPRLTAVYGELMKIRLSALVVVTTAVGFIMASKTQIDWLTLFWTVTGTTACAGSAAALNQLAEKSRDERMKRTENRPLPSGHVSRAHAFIFGIVLAYIGVSILSFGANIEAAGIALLTIVMYILVYTPLKSRTSFNTIVGAIVGALPPLIGWVAVRGEIGAGGLFLAGILFVWQLPHFLALAWMYREDYELGGFKMLPHVDESGELTSRMSVITSLCLVPLPMFMTIVGLNTIAFGVLGSLLGVWLTHKAFLFWKERDDAIARKLFFATIIYLPVLLTMIVIDHQILKWVLFTAEVI